MRRRRRYRAEHACRAGGNEFTTDHTSSNDLTASGAVSSWRRRTHLLDLRNGASWDPAMLHSSRLTSTAHHLDGIGNTFIVYQMIDFIMVVVHEATGTGESTAVAHPLASSPACHAWRFCRRPSCGGVVLLAIPRGSVFKNQLGDLKSAYRVLHEEPPCSIVYTCAGA